MGPTQIDLTFVSTKELIAELAKRHDALVIGGMNFKSKDAYNVVRFRQGHRHVCLGLLSNIQSIINDEENKNLLYNTEDNA